ncbi:thiamine pyrophosphate-binding protein [Naasia aerilata]|uniref:Thiamine pyrophosphate enzyme N-terminal TPP-binding domain-containing protein n=1 Tax=Naasia aerilata TaxID=1162966 RepID=A0ABN6XP58_9MICO|nr:hypothetical protein GCM10025866_15110 [Naasia aerilata]
MRIDERDAGFLALGIAAETGTLVPVIVTSGTAVANLHPAMLEAWHSGVPIAALTADRPPELRGVGANQATRQPGIFGPAAVWSTDEPAPSAEDGPGRAAALADEVLHHAHGGPSTSTWPSATRSPERVRRPRPLRRPRRPLARKRSRRSNSRGAPW